MRHKANMMGETRKIPIQRHETHLSATAGQQNDRKINNNDPMTALSTK